MEKIGEVSTIKTTDGSTVECDFCGKTRGNVYWIIAGPKANICEECSEICCIILAEKGLKLEMLHEAIHKGKIDDRPSIMCQKGDKDERCEKGS